MTAISESKSANAWTALDVGVASGDIPYPEFALIRNGAPHLFSAIAEGDLVLAAEPGGNFARLGRVLRLRSDIEHSMVYFDKLLQAESEVMIASAGLSLPASGSVGRRIWKDQATTV